MKILCVIPPYIPSYFNAGHHLPVFQVGAYLRAHLPHDEIICLDCATLSVTWKEICDLLIPGFDVIAMLNDFDAVDTFERFIYYKNHLTPQAKVISFGRLSKQIPRFFFQFGIDAVHTNGDYEAGVLAYIHYLKGQSQLAEGVLLSKESKDTLGKYLSPEEWVLPDVKEIPYSHYGQMYKRDFNKFCGIPERQELVVPIARGCPVGCAYCDVPGMQGNKERRLPVDATVKYIVDAFNILPFEYVSFYVPTFTLNRKWVLALCDTLIGLKKTYPWKCVTVLKMLDEELMANMSKSGCVRISLGIESFTNTAAMGLPKVKQDTLEHFKSISALCHQYNIELNCFIILGLPGDHPLDVKHTIEICLEHGARVRPTIYTPYHLMNENMSLAEAQQYNRQLFPDGLLPDNIASQYYGIFYHNKKDKETRVMERIAKHVESVQ